MNCIDIKSVVKTFERGRGTFNAVDGVSLSVEKGEFLQIIGRSGSGKTTLLYLLLGLLECDEGNISILGKNLSELESKDAFRNENIGYVPQGNSLIMNLNVRDNIRLPHFLQPRDYSVEERVDELISMLNMEKLAKMLPHSLSGGEIRRIMVARAMLNRPEVIIADEPTSNLDTENTAQVMEMFKSLHDQGATVVMVTHEADILKYGTRTVEMLDGKFKEG